jgi:ABC-type sugar transport system ATPase subunit
LSELTGLSDRILAFHQGRLAGEIAGADMDGARLLQLIAPGEAEGEGQQTSREGVA